MSGSNRLSGLKARPKDTTAEVVRRVDDVGEARGFLTEHRVKNQVANQAHGPGSSIPRCFRT